MFYNNGYMQPNYYNPMNNGAVPDNLSMLRQQGQYQQPYSPYQTNVPQNAQSSNGMIWVQGEEGAKAYLVANGNTVVLWDSENPTIYLKSADNSGMPSMRILDWKERTAPAKAPLQAAESVQSDFITRGEFDALKSRLEDFIKEKETVDKT